jgi:endonuclease G
MIPQSPANNREVWNELEQYSRKLVEEGKELYIIAGPEGRIKAIANGRVTVPRYTWKIIVVLDRPGSGLRDITADTRAIAIRMPNTQRVANTAWRDYRVSIDVLEAATGYDFLSNLPAGIQAAIESRVDNL